MMCYADVSVSGVVCVVRVRKRDDNRNLTSKWARNNSTVSTAGHIKSDASNRSCPTEDHSDQTLPVNCTPVIDSR